MLDVSEPWLFLASLSDYLKAQNEKSQIQEQKLTALIETVHSLQSQVCEIKDKQDWEHRAEEEVYRLRQLPILDSESGEIVSVEDFQSQNA